MRRVYFDIIRSEKFIKKLISNFEKHAYKTFWEFPGEKISVGYYFKVDPCGIGASVGKLFERVFNDTCRKFKIPCDNINNNDADFIIDNTRFELKTTRCKSNNEILFIGSGVQGQGHKKCGNYILISYKMDLNKIVSSKHSNEGLIKEFFYSVNKNIIKTEDWINGGGKVFKLRIPICKFKKISNNINWGSIKIGNKNINYLTSKV